jgi:hypothetical protein
LAIGTHAHSPPPAQQGDEVNQVNQVNRAWTAKLEVEALRRLSNFRG